MLVKAKDVNLHYTSVSLKAVQENLKPSLKVVLFPKAKAQRGSNLSAFVFQRFMHQISYLEITSELNFILLPSSTGPTLEFKITPHTNGEFILFPYFSCLFVCPSACQGKGDLDLGSDPA